MRTEWNRCVPLVALTLFLASGAGHISPLWGDDKPAYRWSRKVMLTEQRLDVVPAAVRLDAHFLASTREGWPDVRLRTDQGEPLGFVIRKVGKQKSTSSRRFWPAVMTSGRVEQNNRLLVEFQLPDRKQNGSSPSAVISDDEEGAEQIPQGIRIVTPLSDFEHQVRVETSSDGQTWKPAGAPGLIFDYSRHVDARNELVPFPAGTDRRFRLTVDNITAGQESQLLQLRRNLRGSTELDRTENTLINRRPFRVERIEFYRDTTQLVRGNSALAKRSAGELEITEEPSRRRTIVQFQTGFMPVTEIEVFTKDNNFSRAVVVEAEVEERGGRREWKRIGSGALRWLNVGSIQQRELALKVPETHASVYRLVIENRDSPPLTLERMELAGPSYELAFLATADSSFHLEYGSPTRGAGEYDIAALTAALAKGQTPIVATLGEPAEVSEIESPAWRPWNDARLMIFVILALVALLGWGLYQAGRRVGTTPLE